MTLSRLLTLSVTFRDEPAAAEIQPAAAAAYLTARGWTEQDWRFDIWRLFRRGADEIRIPKEPAWIDYGRRMCDLINNLAEHEGRSPLAVYVEMEQGT